MWLYESLSKVDYASFSCGHGSWFLFFSTPKQRDIPIHVKMVVVAGASMERQWWWRTPSFEQESGVRWCFSLRSMDGILHMWSKCWRRPWCALSMVHDQSQIGLYIHRIVARGSYGLATEWSLHPCVLPCLSLPLEDAAYSLWISGVHGSLEDTMEILWKLGCGPLKSCNRGNACAWTGCLQLIVRSKWPKKMATHAYCFFPSR